MWPSPTPTGRSGSSRPGSPAGQGSSRVTTGIGTGPRAVTVAKEARWIGRARSSARPGAFTAVEQRRRLLARGAAVRPPAPARRGRACGGAGPAPALSSSCGSLPPPAARPARRGGSRSAGPIRERMSVIVQGRPARRSAHLIRSSSTGGRVVARPLLVRSLDAACDCYAGKTCGDGDRIAEEFPVRFRRGAPMSPSPHSMRAPPLLSDTADSLVDLRMDHSPGSRSRAIPAAVSRRLDS
jgi:hypothetical protein